MRCVSILAILFSFMFCLLGHSRDTEVVSSTQKKERILRHTGRKLNRDFAKSEKKTSLFYLRQTLEGQEREEVLEAVLEARSGVNLRDMSVLNGRMSKKMAEEPTLPYSVVTAMYHFLQLGPMVCREKYWAGTKTPFACKVPAEGHYYENSPYAPKPVPDERYPVRFGELYKVNIDKTNGADGEQLYRADLDIREDNSVYAEEARSTKYQFIRHVLKGTMQIEKKGKRLRSFEGRLEYEDLGRKVIFDNDSYLQIEYTHRRGFTEVERIECSVSVEGHRYRLELFNIGQKKPDGLQAVPIDEDIIKAVRQAGYNPELWENEAVKEAIKKTE